MEPGELKRLALLAVLFVAFGMGLWWPAHNERQELQQRIDAARLKLDRNYAGASELPMLHRRVMQLGKTLEGAQRYVPQKDELDHLLRDLTTAMQTHHVKNAELVTSETKAFAGYSLVPMALQFEASFPQVFGVLDRVESMSRLVRIDELEVEPKDKAEGSPLTVKIKLSTFFMRGGEKVEKKI